MPESCLCLLTMLRSLSKRDLHNLCHVQRGPDDRSCSGGFWNSSILMVPTSYPLNVSCLHPLSRRGLSSMSSPFPILCPVSNISLFFAEPDLVQLAQAAPGNERTQLGSLNLRRSKGSVSGQTPQDGYFLVLCTVPVGHPLLHSQPTH